MYNNVGIEIIICIKLVSIKSKVKFIGKTYNTKITYIYLQLFTSQKEKLKIKIKMKITSIYQLNHNYNNITIIKRETTYIIQKFNHPSFN